MTIKTLEKIISELAKGEVKIENIALFNNGETLLHPKLEQILEKIAELKHKINSPVSLVTNATLLSPNKISQILNSKALDEIVFSLDGGNKKDYEYIRNGANWEITIKNVKKFLQLRNNKKSSIKVGIRSIFYKSPVFDQEYLEIVRQVDNWWPILPHSWDGTKKYEGYTFRKLTKKSFCNFIFDNLAIHWNGLVSPCCNDQNSRGLIGNINHQTLKQIYLSTARRRMINLMARNQRQKIPLCCKCSM